jgi:isopenicillin N synthase-like dioxygenase
VIPVLDWPDYARAPDAFAAELGRACRDTGFFLLTGHGISPALTDQILREADRIFDLPTPDKEKLSILRHGQNRGWVAKGTERLDEKSGQVDRKEAFNIGLDLEPDDPRVLAGEPFRALNVWPDLPGFRATTLRYFNALWGLGVDLHRAVARDLGLPEHHFCASFDTPLATLRLLRYPPGTGAEGEIGAGAHTDYGSLTLLLTDGEPGLQVRPRGRDWMDVPHAPGAFVVNIGDCLMRWTNDTYVSTPHRVRPPRHRRRSVAFFLDPNPDAVIAPLPGTGVPKYPAITGAAYLRSRLDATYSPDTAA